MACMFYGSKSFDADLSAWDVSEIEYMDFLFAYKDEDGYIIFLNARGFNGDVSAWNVSKVRRMNGMFSGASAFNGDLRSWNAAERHGVQYRTASSRWFGVLNT